MKKGNNICISCVRLCPYRDIDRDDCIDWDQEVEITSEIAIDERFKVSKEQVHEMEILRFKGISYRKIAQMFSISPATAQYWTDDVYRGKQRKKNALRKSDSRTRLNSKLKQNSKFTWEYAVGYIAKQVYSEKHKKRPSAILGMPWQYWDTFLNHEWKRGGLKIK